MTVNVARIDKLVHPSPHVPDRIPGHSALSGDSMRVEPGSKDRPGRSQGRDGGCRRNERIRAHRTGAGSPSGTRRHPGRPISHANPKACVPIARTGEIPSAYLRFCDLSQSPFDGKAPDIGRARHAGAAGRGRLDPQRPRETYDAQKRPPRNLCSFRYRDDMNSSLPPSSPQTAGVIGADPMRSKSSCSSEIHPMGLLVFISS